MINRRHIAIKKVGKPPIGIMLAQLVDGEAPWLLTIFTRQVNTWVLMGAIRRHLSTRKQETFGLPLFTIVTVICLMILPIYRAKQIPRKILIDPILFDLVAMGSPIISLFAKEIKQESSISWCDIMGLVKWWRTRRKDTIQLKISKRSNKPINLLHSLFAIAAHL